MLNFTISDFPAFLAVAVPVGAAVLYGIYSISLEKEKKDKFDLSPNEKNDQSNLEETLFKDSELQSNEVAIQHEKKEFEIDEVRKDPDVRIEVKGVEEEEKAQIELGFKLSNILIDGIRHRVEVVDDLKPSDFAVKKLSLSNYPFEWNRAINTEQRGDTMLVDYRLPDIEELPEFLEIAYKKEQPVTVSPNEKRIKDLWTSVSYQIVLRSIYELFSSIGFEGIDVISFNGTVFSLDRATGHQSEKCIMSIMVNRNDFMDLDFIRLDPKQCFKRLKGVAAHDLASLTPIPPIMTMNRMDKRFVTAESILYGIDSGDNLAVMDWKDFENLIRELFEKEFSSEGSEVKITRASKDGGVDAIVFDPDPIRGGKIVIQAKRYTNTVGVSAVRDLYGTVHNEGAIKGILITTSDYGSDSYNFAKDKPITLLNGANLLHLMGKHGYKARINIAEAKKFLKETEYE